MDVSVIVWSLAVIGCVSAIICCALVVVCCALVLYIGVMCRRRVLVSYIGIMDWLLLVGRALVVCCWSSAIVRHKSLVVHHRLLAVLHCPLLVVGCPYSIVHHLSLADCCPSLVIHHPLLVVQWLLLVVRCWLSAVSCHWSSSLIVVGGCRCKARLYMGRVESGLFQVSGHLQRKKKVVSEMPTVLDSRSTLAFSPGSSIHADQEC